MLDYANFYDIAEYGNEHWKGSFTPKETACNAYDYLLEFEKSKNDEKPSHTIKELCELLAEDGSDEAKDWLYQIADELGLTERSKKMNYKLIIESGEYALILRGSQMKEYAVVNGLDKTNGVWAWTCVYYNFDSISPLSQTEALANAIDYFRTKTEKDYIPRCRLEELATQFKDGLIEDDRDSALEYFDDCCEMSEEEKSFFDIEEDSPIANTKFENPMYNKGYDDDGFVDGTNSIEE